MNPISYAIATASPSYLLLLGFVAGVLACNVVGVLVDAYMVRRHG